MNQVSDDHEIALEEEFARTNLNRATFGRLIAYLKPFRGPLNKVVLLEAVLG